MMSRKFFKLQLEHWEKWAKVISIDLPGHGSALDETLTMPSALTSVEECLTELAPNGKVIIVGWGLGGYVAMKYAALNSEQVVGLVLGGCGTEQFGGKSQFYSGILQAMCRVIPDKYLWTFFPKYYPHIPRV